MIDPKEVAVNSNRPLNFRRETAYTALALIVIAAGLAGVTWLAERPSEFAVLLRRCGWVLWLGAAIVFGARRLRAVKNDRSGQ